MKKLSIHLYCLLLVFLLFSCGSTKTEELVSESSDKAAQVKISGKRLMALDPLQTSIIINGYNQSDTLMTEIYARDLNSESVKFAWTSNTTCTVTFIQQDDSKRNLNIRFSEDGNSLKETNN